MKPGDRQEEFETLSAPKAPGRPEGRTDLFGRYAGDADGIALGQHLRFIMLARGLDEVLDECSLRGVKFLGAERLAYGAPVMSRDDKTGAVLIQQKRAYVALADSDLNGGKELTQERLGKPRRQGFELVLADRLAFSVKTMAPR